MLRRERGLTVACLVRNCKQHVEHRDLNPRVFLRMASYTAITSFLRDQIMTTLYSLDMMIKFIVILTVFAMFARLQRKAGLWKDGLLVNSISMALKYMPGGVIIFSGSVYFSWNPEFLAEKRLLQTWWGSLILIRQLNYLSITFGGRFG